MIGEPLRSTVSASVTVAPIDFTALLSTAPNSNDGLIRAFGNSRHERRCSGLSALSELNIRFGN
jgi:hypothetical protein